MSKELTEKWKNGELDCGWYYIKIYWGAGYDTIFDYNTANGEFADFGKKSVKEVLAPVPSYDEHNELKQDNKYLKSGIETRDKQIEQLEKRLEIATKALKKYMTFCRHPAREALKEMEGVK